MNSSNELLRHFLAAIAYRTTKAVRDTDADFGEFRASPGVRTPRQIVRHMSDVLGYARTVFTGGTWRAHSLPSWNNEIERFYEVLTELSELIKTAEPKDVTPAQLLQGPLADAMTHAGQLSMLRRMFGDPIPPENFIVADIESGQTTATQPDAVSPDEKWYDAEEEPF